MASDRTRREVLGGGAALIVGLGWAARAGATPRKAAVAQDHEAEEDVTPAEDLMREHGVLNRLLLVYEEAERRLRGEAEIDRAVVGDAARIIRRFVEDYHERLEEEHLFPRFEKARRLMELVDMLRAQHQAGRRLTDRILQLAKQPAGAQGREGLAECLRLFVRMYRPHEAREDTVLFPAFRKLLPGDEYRRLGDAFERREHSLFGEEGFEKTVASVAGLEKALGIHDLRLVTPPAR